ncbi:MAG: NAD-dependent epimerase/dehydratase family protein [Candidatus Omnitrophica bacterium]|nr:NAD-dependent epimerase/dehydratase family protein [Candidatus Omnitrophota bacterium]
MNILITGATGFIGRHLVRELSRSNDAVFCLVRNAKRAGILAPYKVRLIYGNITDYASLEGIREKIDVIFHCAAVVSNKNRELLHAVNVLGTQNVCRFAFGRGVSRMIYTSSVACVSGHDVVPLVEELPYEPNNPYGVSKIAAEKIVLEYRRKGLKVAVVRPCMVYGEDEPHLLKLFVLCVKYGILPVLGGGRNRFHLAYVENVVAALIHGMNDDRMLEGTFFIADDEVLTSSEVMHIMAQAVKGPRPKVISSGMTEALLKIPYFGKKLDLLLKDREYSQARIKAAGFRHPYAARPSLEKSCREISSCHTL